MRVEANPASAEGDIADAAGASVGRRVLPRKTTDCSGAARALGVWASLVLDAESQRAEHDAAQPAPAPTSPSAVIAASAPGEAPWPAPETNEKPPPEAEWYLHHEDARSLELGAGAFLLTGTVGGALLGPTAFVVVETGRGVFLRPSVALGATVAALPSSGPRSTWATSRLDVCLRIPGFYPHRQGIQIDGCAGGDAGLSFLDNPSQQTVPYLALGPSLDLRGELGQLSAVLRGVFGVSPVRTGFADNAGNQLESSLWSGRVELALSWSVR
jgi:hypothetical protein